MKELFAAFAKAQAKIGVAIKDSTNPHFRSKYADLSSVVAAIKPALAEYGLGFYQRFTPADGGVCIETVIIHESGQELATGPLFVPASKADAQGYGSAITYARRYSLQTALGVPADDDDGNAAVKTVDVQPVQISAIKATAQGLEVDRAKIHQIATRLTDYVSDEENGADHTHGIFEEVEGLTNEEKLALWELLGSKVRSRVKKVMAEMRQAAAREAA